jgi:hypothetical protein
LIYTSETDTVNINFAESRITVSFTYYPETDYPDRDVAERCIESRTQCDETNSNCQTKENAVSRAECCNAGFKTEDSELISSCDTIETFFWHDWVQEVGVRCFSQIEAVCAISPNVTQTISAYGETTEDACCDGANRDGNFTLAELACGSDLVIIDSFVEYNINN